MQENENEGTDCASCIHHILVWYVVVVTVEVSPQAYILHACCVSIAENSF